MRGRAGPYDRERVYAVAPLWWEVLGVNAVDLPRLPLQVVSGWLPTLEKMRRDREDEQRKAQAEERRAARAQR